MAVSPKSGIARYTFTTGARQADTIPSYGTIPRIAQDPPRAFEDVGQQSPGEVVRLDLGLSSWCIVTDSHVRLAEAC